MDFGSCEGDDYVGFASCVIVCIITVWIVVSCGLLISIGTCWVVVFLVVIFTTFGWFKREICLYFLLGIYLSDVFILFVIYNFL